MKNEKCTGFRCIGNAWFHGCECTFLRTGFRITAAQRTRFAYAGVPSESRVRSVNDLDAFCIEEYASVSSDQAWIINCVGITKPMIHDDNPGKVGAAMAVNASFPHRLGHL